jgi:hypothetical protein
MKITTVKLTKAKLARMPSQDRTLLLSLGNVSNEINVLQKLMMMVPKEDPTREVRVVEQGQGSAAGLTAATAVNGLPELFDVTLKSARRVAELFQVLMVEIISKSIDGELETEDVDPGELPKNVRVPPTIFLR